ncbi:MAG TPA: hypothetical protein DEF41_05315 [Desulfovibrio sp.]|nr:hypothetical protein [Desulfovibrio sp.]
MGVERGRLKGAGEDVWAANRWPVARLRYGAARGGRPVCWLVVCPVTGVAVGGRHPVAIG